MNILNKYKKTVLLKKKRLPIFLRKNTQNGIQFIYDFFIGLIFELLR